MSDEPVTASSEPGVIGARFARVRARMAEVGVEALLLSTGADLPWLTGYEAMPLERLTMLVLPTAGEAVLVVPRLEAPRVTPHEAFLVHPWDETDDPVALVAGLLGGATQVAVGDHTWARFVVELLAARPDLALQRAVAVTGPLRMVKDAAEIAALQRGADAVDAIALALRDRPFAGRSELEVSRELVESMLGAGHERANFAIVATGPNGASPHHDPTDRVIAPGDVVLCDFGGTIGGYCSDITRMFVVGEPNAEVRDVYDVLVAAQEAGVQAGVVGAPCESGRRRHPRGHRRRGLRRLLRAPHRSRHRHRGARGPLHGRGQHPAHRARLRVERGARHLPARTLRPPARGHRRRHGRRPAPPHPRAARPRDRALT